MVALPMLLGAALGCALFLWLLRTLWRLLDAVPVAPLSGLGHQPFGALPEPTRTGSLGQMSPDADLSGPMTPHELLGPGS